MADEITDAELAEIEVRAAAATPGPWGTLWDGQQFQVVSPHDTAPGECIAEWTYAVRTREPEATADRAECMTEDGVFIAAARTDVPRLVAALRAAYVERDQAKAELAAAVVEWGEWWPDGDVVAADDREQAQRWVNVNGPNHKVVRRRVTEWQPIEEGVDRG